MWFNKQKALTIYLFEEAGCRHQYKLRWNISWWSYEMYLVEGNTTDVLCDDYEGCTNDDFGGGHIPVLLDAVLRSDNGHPAADR